MGTAAEDLVITCFEEDHDPEQHIGDPLGPDPTTGAEETGLAPTVRLAPALRTLRDEVNKRWPNRDRRSDGWIGDAAHQAGKSDHNPDADGSVNALDLDKDGIDPQLVVDQCIVHPATQYVIFNRTIWSRTRDFRPARYTGSNPHDKHVHISVSHTPSLENSLRAWGIAASAPVPAKLGDRLLRLGCEGSDVRELQSLANKLGAGLTVDGVFGPRTQAWVQAFQKARKLTVDGIVGPRTVATLLEAAKPKPAPEPKPAAKPTPKPAAHRPGTRTVRRGMSGDDVAFVQRFIGRQRCGEPTGTFDSRTEVGVRWYQRMRGIADDGVVGRITWAEMRVTVSF